MSVEEARDAISDALVKATGVVEAEFGEDAAQAIERELDAALDRLILEVQAEMPCCYAYVNRRLPWERDKAERWCEIRDWRIEDRCPSCTARAELARRKVPA